MTFPRDTSSTDRPDASDVSIIRREFVELTENPYSAVILNQLLYWTLRVKDFDHLLEEERTLQPDCNVSPRHGWIYKTAQELAQETMLGLSPPSIRKYLKFLIDQGWIDERNHPTEKWDKTTQYRVNLKNLQEDLMAIGRALPGVYLKALPSSLQRNTSGRDLHRSCENTEEMANERNVDSNESLEEHALDTAPESEEIPNEKNFGSNEKIFASEERNFASNEKFFASNTENTTKTTHKNTNKDDRPRARETFSGLEKVLVGESGVGQSIKHNSVAQDMLDLWEQHIGQKLALTNRRELFHLTKAREGMLESLFAFHFQNDIRLWERFCMQVKRTPFLMGGGPRGWVVNLNWILRDGSVPKVLEGKYEDSNRNEQESTFAEDLAKMEPNPVRDAEKAAILASIKDPTWKEWCTQLAAGVRLNDFKMLHEPLSIADLKQIAHARFLECEDERLVWVGSSDPCVLRKIEDIHLKISWVFAKKYPKASTFRTRLEVNPNPQITTTGGINHA